MEGWFFSAVEWEYQKFLDGLNKNREDGEGTICEHRGHGQILVPQGYTQIEKRENILQYKFPTA